jgi:hypothetical protein
MAKKLSKARKSAMIVDPKTSGAARAKATREATSMLSKKRPIDATRLTRGR